MCTLMWFFLGDYLDVFKRKGLNPVHVLRMEFMINNLFIEIREDIYMICKDLTD